MPAGNEASAGARGRHVVGVAVRTYVADQRSSSPAHPAARLLLLLATLAADSRGIFCIPLAVSVDARRPKHQAYASTLSSSWLAAFRHSPRRYVPVSFVYQRVVRRRKPTPIGQPNSETRLGLPRSPSDGGGGSGKERTRVSLNCRAMNTGEPLNTRTGNTNAG